MIHAAANRKALGAYYTGAAVAELIARWAIREGDRVLDPSCGDGAFLRAACSIAARPSKVVGVEVSPLQAAETRAVFRNRPWVNVVTADFFDFENRKFDCVIGNPPFIRYHSFTGATREKALFRCARAGVKVSRLTSSWAPFVICSSELLADGGKLGFVLPAELLHAGYARAVLKYLNASFESVTIVTFKERLFPELAQDAVVLLASGKGARCSALLHVEAESVEHVSDLSFESRGRAVDPQAYLCGGKRIKETLVDSASADILERLLNEELAYRLGTRMRADIGYVTGANEFFHLSEAEARRRRITPRFLSPTVYRGASLSGISYSVDDWIAGNANDTSGYLLRVEPTARLSSVVQAYVAEGIGRGFNKRYKCRVRDPWYSVPHIYWPEAFLTSMSGERPAIVVNEANVLASNSLHILRTVHPACHVRALALSWLSSVTSLSIEIEGHALGGGMLKLEPTEAERVVVVDLEGAFSDREFRKLDRLVRRSRIDEATTEVDRRVAQVTGASLRDLERVRGSATELRARRIKRRK